MAAPISVLRARIMVEGCAHRPWSAPGSWNMAARIGV
jgi:hypothetical protein